MSAPRQKSIVANGTAPPGNELAVRLVVPYPPSANAYWRHNRGRTHVSDEARKYRNAVALMALAAGWRPRDGECSLVVDVYRPQRRGDLDNTLKVLLDALRGAAYRDDSQIKTISASRHDDKERPRAEVSILWAKAATSEPERSPSNAAPNQKHQGKQ